MVYFDQILHTYACQHCLIKSLACVTVFFLVDVLSISPTGRGQLVKVLITLEPHGIFRSNFTLLFFNILQPLVCITVTRLLGDFQT